MALLPAAASLGLLGAVSLPLLALPFARVAVGRRWQHLEAVLPDGKILCLPFLGLRQGGGRVGRNPRKGRDQMLQRSGAIVIDARRAKCLRSRNLATAIWQPYLEEGIEPALRRTLSCLEQLLGPVPAIKRLNRFVIKNCNGNFSLEQ